MGRRGYPPEFRRKVLDLVEAGEELVFDYGEDYWRSRPQPVDDSRRYDPYRLQ